MPPRRLMRLVQSADLNTFPADKTTLTECHNKQWQRLKGDVFISNVPFITDDECIHARLGEWIGPLIEVNRLGHFQLNGNYPAMCSFVFFFFFYKKNRSAVMVWYPHPLRASPSNLMVFFSSANSDLES